MTKSYEQDAEEKSVFLSPVRTDFQSGRKGERDNTSPLRGARLIDIERITPDPNQPRKTFRQETLGSLAESIRELGGIIDPLTVEYNEGEDIFRIISGERRYRAAKMVGLEKLPCIMKEMDEKTRLLLQLIANLQREDITALEESEGIKSLIEKYGYSQARVAKIMNKSESYVSQILGLQRLSPSAREILQTSEVAKEVQIQASKHESPKKQKEILKKASDQGKTVKQIRVEGKTHAKKSDEAMVKSQTFSKWSWEPQDGRFVITVKFRKGQLTTEKIAVLTRALEEAHDFVKNQLDRNGHGEKPNGA
jgi:ParB family chromosome partitioning protein